MQKPRKTGEQSPSARTLGFVCTWMWGWPMGGGADSSHFCTAGESSGLHGEVNSGTSSVLLRAYPISTVLHEDHFKMHKQLYFGKVHSWA